MPTKSKLIAVTFLAPSDLVERLQKASKETKVPKGEILREGLEDILPKYENIARYIKEKPV